MNELVLVFIVVDVVWLLVLSCVAVYFYKKYKKILSGVEGKDLEKILVNHIERVDKAVQDNVRIDKELEEFRRFAQQYLYKVGFKRFNPFNNTGGNHSFALSLLDNNNDGIVISSMHGRDGTRVYAKSVSNGKEEPYKFSQEEREVVDEAMNK